MGNPPDDAIGPSSVMPGMKAGQVAAANAEPSLADRAKAPPGAEIGDDGFHYGGGHSEEDADAAVATIGDS